MDKDASHQSTNQASSAGETLDKSLLVVDDDRLFCERLARALATRGFTARTATSVSEAMAAIETAPPAFAVIDLRLGDGSGLDVMRALKARRPDSRGVMLTGYGAIATAVMAVKLGAFDYLAKPANADDVVAALMAGRRDSPAEHEPPMSADRVRWEHIQRIYEACDRNVSETARQLNMHRRTLQRILAKRAPTEGAARGGRAGRARAAVRRRNGAQSTITSLCPAARVRRRRGRLARTAGIWISAAFRGVAQGPRSLRGSDIWISLDFLVTIVTFQRLARDSGQKNSGLAFPRRNRSRPGEHRSERGARLISVMSRAWRSL